MIAHSLLRRSAELPQGMTRPGALAASVRKGQGYADKTPMRGSSPYCGITFAVKNFYRRAAKKDPL